MAKVFDSFVEELEARVAIEDTLKRFCRGVDRQDWALARTLYHDGGYDDHGFFKGTGDALLEHVAELHRHQDHSMHFISNVLIDFQTRDRAIVESYVLVLQRFGPEAPDVPPGSHGVRKLASARYVDQFEKRKGEWRVVHRTLVFGDTQAEPMEQPHRFPPSFVEQQHGTSDVLYKILLGTR